MFCFKSIEKLVNIFYDSLPMNPLSIQQCIALNNHDLLPVQFLKRKKNGIASLFEEFAFTIRDLFVCHDLRSTLSMHMNDNNNCRWQTYA